jgi:tetratricopeptide (TPR) repeat protein
MNRDFRRLINLLRSFAVDFRATYIPTYYAEAVRRWPAYGSPTPTEKQLLRWEEAVTANPWDLKSRTKLILRYSHLRNELAKQKHAEHIFWIAENRPDHPVASLPQFRIIDLSPYRKIRAVWLNQMTSKSKSKIVLANAANFLQNDEDPQVAEYALLKAIELAPKNVSLRSQLSRLYARWAGHENAAFVALDEICKSKIPERFFYDFKDLPSRAFKAGHYDRAVDTAEQLLKISREEYQDGNVEHQAHTVLGRVALQHGDRKKARTCLRRSLKCVKPRLFIGPNLELVKDMVSLGETESALEFLDQMEFLVGFDDERIFEVRFQIETGLIVEKANFELDEQFYKLFHAYKLSKFALRTQDIEKLSKAVAQARRQCDHYRKISIDYKTSKEGVTVHLQNLALLYEDYATELDALIQNVSAGTEL